MLRRIQAGIGLFSMASLVVVLFGCSGSTPKGQGGQPILVGASVSLSGDFAADGTAAKQGYELWADYVNGHGGLLGRQVKLDLLDDASDPQQAITVYQKLATNDHVVLLF